MGPFLVVMMFFCSAYGLRRSSSLGKNVTTNGRKIISTKSITRNKKKMKQVKEFSLKRRNMCLSSPRKNYVNNNELKTLYLRQEVIFFCVKSLK
mmetsp:Transcript_17819/g.21837  ORF Transcript_17819/g.21837 Transcript_17819/m.21837 type:complete len:94 (+) Transcript_17819:103-384(+)